MVCGPVINVSSGGNLIVSSTTRPTGTDRYTGVRIFEADTGREMLWDGSGWVIMSEPAQVWTGMWSGFTNTTGSGWYHRNDGYFDFYALAVFSGAPVGTPFLTFPVAMDAAGIEQQFHGNWTDAGVGRGPLLATVNSSSSVVMAAINASATYATYTNVTGTIPATFGVNDSIMCSGRFKMASRYS